MIKEQTNKKHNKTLFKMAIDSQHKIIDKEKKALKHLR